METDGFAPLDESAVGSLYSAPELGSEGGYEGKEVDVFAGAEKAFATKDTGPVKKRRSTATIKVRRGSQLGPRNRN